MKVEVKNRILGIIFIIVLCNIMINRAEAQYVSNSLNYQAVARDAQGKPLDKVKLTVQTSIIAQNPNGELEWQEEHQVETNSLGLFTLNIGTGNKTGGSASELSKINWGGSAHFLKVEIDFGSGLVHMGTTQMLAVPYALYAEKAGNSISDFSGISFDAASNTLKNNGNALADLSPLKQHLQFDQANYHLSISGETGIIDLRNFIHAPQDLRSSNNKIWLTGNADSTIVDLSPYKQTLAISNTSKLQISGSNEVPIDTSNVNEIQSISRIGSNILLSRNGGEVSIDTSNMNEIQTISLSGNKVSLNKAGGEITLDVSESNELQDLQLANNKLSLSKSTARAIPVDTSNVNEIQLISLSGNKLSLNQSGGDVTIDANESNELQDLQLANNKLSLSNSSARAIPVDTSNVNEIQDLYKISGKLSLSNSTARAIPIDTSDVNEFQNIARAGDKLSLTNSSVEVSLNDADADPSNELISNISYNQKTSELTIQESTYSKKVKLSSEIVGFRVFNLDEEYLPNGTVKTIIFPEIRLNENNGYNSLNGIFTVPSSGFYSFQLNTLYDTGLTFDLMINGQKVETLTSYNQPFLKILNEFDTVSVRISVTANKVMPKIGFIGIKLSN